MVATRPMATVDVPPARHVHVAAAVFVLDSPLVVVQTVVVPYSTWLVSVTMVLPCVRVAVTPGMDQTHRHSRGEAHDEAAEKRVRRYRSETPMGESEYCNRSLQSDGVTLEKVPVAEVGEIGAVESPPWSVVQTLTERVVEVCQSVVLVVSYTVPVVTMHSVIPKVSSTPSIASFSYSHSYVSSSLVVEKVCASMQPWLYRVDYVDYETPC